MVTSIRADASSSGNLSPGQRRHHRTQIQKRLQSIQSEIADLTGRIPSLPQRIEFFPNGELDSSRFHGGWDGKKLQIGVQLLDRPFLLKIVLYRELFINLLPSVIQDLPESGDLGFLCAYQLISDLEKQELLKIWQAVSPQSHYGDTTYHAPLSFPLFNQVTQGCLLRLILPFLDELEPNSNPLTSREFIQLLEMFMHNFASPVTEQELQILHLLQENPSATLKELQRSTSLSLGGLSNYLNGFRQKLLLSRFYRIDFPRIRLNHVAVLVYPTVGSRINRYLEQCPYLRKIHQFGGIGAPYLVTYALPRLRLRRLQEWFQELKGMGHIVRFRFYPLAGVFHGYNLRSYIAHKSDVPVAERFRWVAWIRYLRDVLIRDGYGTVLAQPHIYEYSRPFIEPAPLKPIDYQLLAYLTPENTAEELSSLLDVSIHTIRRRQRFLFEHEVVFKRPDLSIFHLGLNETVFVILEGSSDIVENFLTGCREAPMYGGSIFNQPTTGAIVAFGLPTGLALRVGQELERMVQEQQDFTAAIFYGNGSKDFSVASVLQRCRFNPSNNQWMWHREYLPTAFDHVETHQSSLAVSDDSLKNSELNIR